MQTFKNVRLLHIYLVWLATGSKAGEQEKHQLPSP